MSNQLSLFATATPAAAPAGLPTAVMEILQAAQTIEFSIRIARGKWGVGVGQKRKWVLTGDCCCAIGAYLIVKGATADPRESSPRDTIIRLLCLTSSQLDSFVHGFDGQQSDGSDWYGYGAMVAKAVVHG